MRHTPWFLRHPVPCLKFLEVLAGKVCAMLQLSLSEGFPEGHVFFSAPILKMSFFLFYCPPVGGRVLDVLLSPLLSGLSDVAGFLPFYQSWPSAFPFGDHTVMFCFWFRPYHSACLKFPLSPCSRVERVYDLSCVWGSVSFHLFVSLLEYRPLTLPGCQFISRPTFSVTVTQRSATAVGL